MTSLAMIHVARRELCLDDDSYRDALQRATGRRSAKGLSPVQCKAVVDELSRLGFKPASKRPGKGLPGTYGKKAQALWIALYNLGAVGDRRDSALLAFIKHQTGLERAEWLRDAGQGAAVVEALKSWCGREGVNWQVGETTPDFARRHGYQIAAAQWLKLNPKRDTAHFWKDVLATLGREPGEALPSDAEWIVVMNVFGRDIRARKSKRRAA
mgnify:FL=1